MAQSVWTLSVDLQAKTAVFQSGMADAARAAKGSFQEIKDGAREMGAETGGSMTEARHGVMLLGEEFGVHLPRGLTTFIASLGPVGAAMEAAFPFLAVLVGATLLLQHLAKLREEADKLSQSQLNFGTTVANVLNGLDKKLIEAGIRTDELNHNHLGALNKQLQLIDRASMDDLVQSFGVVAKAADVTFAELKTSWYQWGQGSAGAKHALEDFKNQYDSLLAQGKNKEANDLLAGTKQSAEHVLDLMKQVKDNTFQSGGGGNQHADYNKFEQAKLELKKQGIGYSEKEIEAQKILVGALEAQAAVQQKVDDLKKAQSSNAVQQEKQRDDVDLDKAAREQAQAERQGLEEAEKEREERYKEAVAQLQENEKEKIAATKQGSAARLAAIDAAIKEENGKGLQETGFYHSLLTERVNLIREMAQEQTKLTAEAAKESAQADARMGLLALAHDREMSQLKLSAMRNSEQARLADAVKFANEDYQIQLKEAQQELAALDKSDKEYENKVKQANDRITALTREHENQITQIKVKAEEERNQRILSAEQKRDDAISSSLTKMLMRQESVSKMMISLGDQVVSGMMQNAIKSMLADDASKERDAAKAARDAYKSGVSIGGPFAPILGAAYAAAAFTTVMAFEAGGIVPGVGKGDIVPAMLEPGESVLPKRMTENLQRASHDTDSRGGDTHVHMHITHHVQALDSEGFSRVLDKHADTLNRHLHNQLRKSNR